MVIDCPICNEHFDDTPATVLTFVGHVQQAHHDDAWCPFRNPPGFPVPGQISTVAYDDATPFQVAIAAVGMAVQCDIARSKMFDSEPYDATNQDHRKALGDIAVGYVRVIQYVAETIEAE